MHWWWDLWGGGHTCDTDPTRQGWRALPSKKGSETLLVGKRGEAGCFSAQRLSDVDIDVALYDEPPEEVLRYLHREPGVWCDAAYVSIAMYPGWGLTALEHLRRRMAQAE